MLLEQRHKVFDSRTNLTPSSTSVKRVVSELEATFGLRNKNWASDRNTSAACHRSDETSNTRYFNLKTDVRTQTDREIPETVTIGPTSRLPHAIMESDSSFNDCKQPVPPPNPHAKVTVSTCPSCGSENVSSESHPTKRSASFQHLLQNSRGRQCHVSVSKLSPHLDTNHLLRSQSFTFAGAGDDSCENCHCRCPRLARTTARNDGMRNKKFRKKKSSRAEGRHRPLGDSRYLSIYPDQYWPPLHAQIRHPRPACYTHCKHKVTAYDPVPHRPTVRVDRSRSFVDMSPTLRNNYRFWDIDEWREQMKRDRAKKSERRALMTVSALGIIVFICVSYFGTLLFLRITKLP